MKDAARIVNTRRAPVARPTPEHERAEELTANIKADLDGLKQAFWRIGRALHEVMEKRLFISLGYTSFRDYVAERLDFEREQAYKTIRVARSYFEEDAVQLGLERAAALLPYAKLVKVDPGLLVRENAMVGDKPVVSATKREIATAAAEVRAAIKKRQSRAPAAREQKQAETAVHQGLRDLLKAAALPHPVRIHFDAKTGEVIIRMPGRPLLEHFGR